MSMARGLRQPAACGARFSVGLGSLRRARSRSGRQRSLGFSLIELIAVIVLIATATALAATVMTAGLPGQQLRSAAREMAAQLRYTRAQAIVTGHSQVFSVNADNRDWTAPNHRHGTLPKAIDIVATSARVEQPERGVAAFRFFPDGSSTGGHVLLQRDRAAWRLDIDWLTGQVDVTRTEASR